ncbi:MAG TPA: Imm51 family immunity protein [Chitinophagales bacterium]|nr:Imm51 family immunity protein [Chitinophagales bacterium]
MKGLEHLKIPNNLTQVLEEEGMWEDETFAPVHITVMESEFKGKNVIGFQLEFSPHENFNEINEVMEENGIEVDGYNWEGLIRKFLKKKDKKFEAKVIGDSEGETCVLWTQTEEDFRRLLGFTIEFISNPDNAMAILRG